MILENEREILGDILETNEIIDEYYIFGNYIYENLNIELQETIHVNLDMFKYILGKYYAEALFSQN
tara:strand:- start:631 stop:828 length:198 start_codon:yes stop_codon:yes gene_type:complete